MRPRNDDDEDDDDRDINLGAESPRGHHDMRGSITLAAVGRSVGQVRPGISPRGRAKSTFNLTNDRVRLLDIQCTSTKLKLESRCSTNERSVVANWLRNSY